MKQYKDGDVFLAKLHAEDEERERDNQKRKWEFLAQLSYTKRRIIKRLKKYMQN